MLGSSPALLVFAYTREYFPKARIDGAIPSEEFRQNMSSLPKETEIILYCGCPKDQASHDLARELVASGFSNVRILRGGVLAWIRAGYTLAADPAPVSRQ